MKEVYPGKKPQKEAQIIVDIGLFDAFLLKTSSGLENALSVLETRVSAPGLDLTTFLEELMAVPKLFEFLVSGEPHSYPLLLNVYHKPQL